MFNCFYCNCKGYAKNVTKAETVKNISLQACCKKLKFNKITDVLLKMKFII